MNDILKDFPPGPLDFYRKKSTFDWKKLKIFIESEEIIKYQNELIEELKKYPEFIRSNTILTLDEERHLALRQHNILKKIKLITLDSYLVNIKRMYASYAILLQVNASGFNKMSIGITITSETIRNLGTEIHKKYYNDLMSGKYIGCLCLTEVAHGSNTKAMGTRAIYDRNTKEFILNTPDFESAKCWAGGLGQTGLIGVIFAQLYIDDKNYGLHGFIAPLRDPNTYLPLPGITLGDLGAKIGLNGLDNGILMFHNFRIPKANLLNKFSDVSDDGNYISMIENENRRHGIILSALSPTRISLIGQSEACGAKAITIAIRYAALRKQFGSNKDKIERSILEYQTHQYRLLPYLAGVYVIKIFAINFNEDFMYSSSRSMFNSDDEIPIDKLIEFHCLASACKPISTWFFRECIQECREACGGHGYLKISGFGDLKNDQDAAQTYEGENHVLIQQNSGWLLKFWPKILDNETIQSPLHSVDFLTNTKKILENKFICTSVEEICQLKTIIAIYQWLTCYLLKESWNKIGSNFAEFNDNFWARTNSQVYFQKNLSIVFADHHMLQRAITVHNEAKDRDIQKVLSKLIALYGLFKLERNLGILYRGNYCQGPNFAKLLQEGILYLCRELKDDAVALVDAIAPPDFALNSILGASDGLIYKHLKNAVYEHAYFMSRPKWWKECIDNDQSTNSKL